MPRARRRDTHSVGATLAFARDRMDLLVIGAGTLGARVGVAWRRSQGGRVVAETATPARHAELAALGLEPRCAGDAAPERCGHLLLAVPFSAPGDYLAACRRAVDRWSGGTLVQVSSTAVYAESAGGRCVEGSPLAGGERAQRMLEAEQLVLRAGGVVIRMAGLYDAERGPHRVYARTAESPRRPDGLVNLIHYDDAAELCHRALLDGEPGAVYLGCDGHPLTRSELVAAVAGSCRFTGTEGPLGRRCDNPETRARLGFTPRWPSFLDWAASRR